MTYQQIKKIIRSMMTMDDMHQARDLRDAKWKATHKDMDTFIETAIAYDRYEAEWVWKIVQVTGTDAYHARKYWSDVQTSMWLEDYKAKKEGSE